MRPKPDLNEAEWRLIAELLEREMHELPVEIHHSSLPRTREALRERLTTVLAMRERLQEAGLALEAGASDEPEAAAL